MAVQAVRIVMLLALVTTSVDAYRKKRKGTDHFQGEQAEPNDEQESVDATLRERSASTQSFVEDKRVSLDEAVQKKGGDVRRRRRQSTNGWCLPHQQCTWYDCCALGTSCNTCPGGYHGEVAFGRCAWKGHYVCNKRDCVGSWGAWSGCSAQCGGGNRHSVYQYVHHASSGGQGCPYHNGHTRTETCNTHACPVDCIGAWSGFGSCSLACGGGQQSQTFKVTTAAQHGGNACAHRNGETRSQACNTHACPVNCVGDWGAFGECSATCGGGDQSQTYAVSLEATHGGNACPHKNGESRSQRCHTQECPINCRGSWGQFSACSLTCGGGEQSQRFTVSAPAQFGGTTCSHTDGDTRSQACNTNACPVDCVGGWSEYGKCSATCGGGTRTRNFAISVTAQHGGVACSNTHGQVESQACETQACPIDCVGSWSTFGACSHTCGGGKQSQSFSVSTSAQFGGSTCSHANGETQSQDCNTNACPVDCQGHWSEYGECSATCGGGQRTREFTVTVAEQHGGAACSSPDSEIESQPCETQDCPPACPRWSGPDPKSGRCTDQMTEESIDECCCSAGGCTL